MHSLTNKAQNNNNKTVDYSLRVVARKNPFDEPLLDSREARTIEIRDHKNILVAVILTMPKSPVFIVTKNDQEDFEQVVTNLGLKIDLDSNE
jgi:hypothetical protein